MKGYGGAAFLAVALLCFLAMAYTAWNAHGTATPASMHGYDMLFEYYAAILMPSAVLFVAALTLAFFGTRLLSSASNAGRQVIPDTNKELIEGMLKERNDEGISGYIRLASLTGVTGTFTKLGITGMPLATISLTVLFVFLALAYPTTVDEKTHTALLDLTKLTLGAFIGSFVQRQSADAQKQASDISRIAKGLPPSSGAGNIQPTPIAPPP